MILKKLVIIGAGETARLAYEYFTYDSNYTVCAFAVSEEFKNKDIFYELPLISINDLLKCYPKEEYEVFVALIGDKENNIRAYMCQQFKDIGYKLASYVSSRASVWHNVMIGDNCFIMENNILQPFSRVGNNVVMFAGSCLSHSSTIGDNCYISPNVTICGFAKIGKNTFIGANATVRDNVSIGDYNFICMGSIVTTDTKNKSKIKGFK